MDPTAKMRLSFVSRERGNLSISHPLQSSMCNSALLQGADCIDSSKRLFYQINVFTSTLLSSNQENIVEPESISSSFSNFIISAANYSVTEVIQPLLAEYKNVAKGRKGDDNADFISFGECLAIAEDIQLGIEGSIEKRHCNDRSYDKVSEFGSIPHNKQKSFNQQEANIVVKDRDVSIFRSGSSVSTSREQTYRQQNVNPSGSGIGIGTSVYRSHPTEASKGFDAKAIAAEQEDEFQANKKQKKNPFSSARDRFEEEGGRFDKSTAAVSYVANSINHRNQNGSSSNNNPQNQDKLPQELANCDKALVERIEADIIHHGQSVTFRDIAGLESAKQCVEELICWPMSQPSLFQGLRSLPRGILLFGPPGTGKTLIGKAIAHESGATFFCISASSLMSKWIGEGEKTVRTLFAVATYRQPSVVFIDEVDSLLCQRSSEENEATRRIKTEFMVQLDGANTDKNSRVVIIGATNRPEELDEAVRRRFVKRIYIPLPDSDSRRELIRTLLRDAHHCLSNEDIDQLVIKSEGFSGADISSLCTEAAMGPVREIARRRRGDLTSITKNDVPSISLNHFIMALETVMPSVSPSDLQRYIDWNNSFGSYRVK